MPNTHYYAKKTFYVQIGWILATILMWENGNSFYKIKLWKWEQESTMATKILSGKTSLSILPLFIF